MVQGRGQGQGLVELGLEGLGAGGDGGEGRGASACFGVSGVFDTGTSSLKKLTPVACTDCRAVASRVLTDVWRGRLALLKPYCHV